MNKTILRKLLISTHLAFALTFGVSGMDTDPAKDSQTIRHLKKIADHQCGGIAGEAPVGIEEQIDHILKGFKEPARDPQVVEALALGADLLKTAAKMEMLSKHNNHVLWWRYTHDLEKDISQPQPRSFGKALLAGFVGDGVQHFKSGICGFNTACPYMYWLNAYYFSNFFDSDQIKFAEDLNKFIEQNRYSIKTETLEKIKNYFSFGSKKSMAEKIQFLWEIKKEVDSIITNIQFDPAYMDTLQRPVLEELYNRKVKLFNMVYIDPSELNKAINGCLVLLPLSLEEEKQLLGERHNRQVNTSDESVFDSGEDFHPRLTPLQLKKFKERLIPVYSDRKFVDLVALEGELQKRIGFQHES